MRKVRYREVKQFAQGHRLISCGVKNQSHAAWPQRDRKCE